MIKKVQTDQLKVGVFVHDFNCDKDQNTIFINQTLIKSENVIGILHDWGIKEVYIDTERGLDAYPSATIVTDIDVRLNLDIAQPFIPEDMQPATAPSVPLIEEIQIARDIKKEVVNVLQQTMTSFQQVQSLDIDNAFNILEKMQASVTRNKDALLLLSRIRTKDEYTLMHSISVCSLVMAFCTAYRINHDTTIKLAMGALLHDIGKTKIPLSILNKPGKLDDDEFEIIKKHTEHSAEILARTKDLPDEALDIALHHHERCDGSGYPYNLTKSSLSFGSRLASISDVFDAITAERCYKEKVDKVSGLKAIYDMRDSHLDTKLTEQFIRFIGVYPVGTFVTLENELSGVVVDSTQNLLQPVIRLFYDNKKQVPISITDVDLSEMNLNVACYDSPSEWGVGKQEVVSKCSSILSPL